MNKKKSLKHLLMLNKESKKTDTCKHFLSRDTGSSLNFSSI
jgi:hypothetical protein